MFKHALGQIGETQYYSPHWLPYKQEQMHLSTRRFILFVCKCEYLCYSIYGSIIIQQFTSEHCGI